MLRRLSLLAALSLALPATAQDLTGTLAHINDTGVMTIGYRTDQPPLSFVSESGTPVGYSVEICNRIATDVGETLGRTDLSVEYVAVTAENRLEAVADGTIDILCGATTKTLSRAEQVGFTQLTFATGGAVLSVEANPVNGVREIAGKRVAVTEGTTTIDALSEVVARNEISVEIVPVETVDDGLAALLDGSVDALAADQVVLIGKVLTFSGAPQDFVVSGDLFSFEPFALAIPRGDADFALVADRTISRLFRDGQIVQIYQTYFAALGAAPPNALTALWELMSTPE